MSSAQARKTARFECSASPRNVVLAARHTFNRSIRFQCARKRRESEIGFKRRIERLYLYRRSLVVADRQPRQGFVLRESIVKIQIAGIVSDAAVFVGIGIAAEEGQLGRGPAYLLSAFAQSGVLRPLGGIHEAAGQAELALPRLARALDEDYAAAEVQDKAGGRGDIVEVLEAAVPAKPALPLEECRPLGAAIGPAARLAASPAGGAEAEGQRYSSQAFTSRPRSRFCASASVSRLATLMSVTRGRSKSMAILRMM